MPGYIMTDLSDSISGIILKLQNGKQGGTALWVSETPDEGLRMLPY